ncbi:hypothetical protein SISSUDRAFT_1058355 [Sistotremastrum suecicum HHB10207 ss-3]|uniref:Uncharacterized protein n=1 Tax=Sistotremastrum suecicum HHB10207 ss-3 TaxID=1314776 RepID=A0A166HCT3_9AGAM|nr:hypothetical protein SISSUDRAFT_1058355 [Sistotremastrum suecicum HHB10207 ss-3]
MSSEPDPPQTPPLRTQDSVLRQLNKLTPPSPAINWSPSSVPASPIEIPFIFESSALSSPTLSSPTIFSQTSTVLEIDARPPSRQSPHKCVDEDTKLSPQPNSDPPTPITPGSDTHPEHVGSEHAPTHPSSPSESVKDSDLTEKPLSQSTIRARTAAILQRKKSSSPESTPKSPLRSPVSLKFSLGILSRSPSSNASSSPSVPVSSPSIPASPVEPKHPAPVPLSSSASIAAASTSSSITFAVLHDSVDSVEVSQMHEKRRAERSYRETKTRMSHPLPPSSSEPEEAILAQGVPDSESVPGPSTPTEGPPSRRRVHRPKKPPVSLPSEYSWLKDVIVELWIDQEGFRLVRPKFKLSHFIQQALKSEGSIMSGESQSSSGPIAEFTMPRREKFFFHYATLDSPPLLRRLTISGRDNHDHLSRQAQLSVKGNGVYTVSGLEDKGRLCWKFEYLVEDRRNKADKVIDGEKNFTPISFSCSPELLSPERGKKIKIFQVMRKTITPKLSSSKLSLPTLSSSNSLTNIPPPPKTPEEIRSMERRLEKRPVTAAPDTSTIEDLPYIDTRPGPSRASSSNTSGSNPAPASLSTLRPEGNTIVPPSVLQEWLDEKIPLNEGITAAAEAARPTPFIPLTESTLNLVRRVPSFEVEPPELSPPRKRP